MVGKGSTFHELGIELSRELASSAQSPRQGLWQLTLIIPVLECVQRFKVTFNYIAKIIKPPPNINNK